MVTDAATNAVTTAVIAGGIRYENFREPRSKGIGRLGKVGTLALFVGALVMIALIAIIGLWAGLVFAAVGGLALLAATTRDQHGRTAFEKLGTVIGHRTEVTRGAALYKSGPLSRLGTYRLPGLLAQTELTEHQDAAGNPYGLVATPAVHHFAVTVQAHPDGSSLLAADDLTANVDRWGEFLGFLSHEPGLVQVMVVVEAAPDAGPGLRREITANVAAGAPQLAQEVLAEVAQDYPKGSASVRTFVTLTFDGRQPISRNRLRKRTADEMAQALAARLPEIVGKLSSTGAGACELLDAQAVCQVVRIAYDPAAADALADLAAQGDTRPWAMRWDSIGPAAADAQWSFYRHSSGVSVSWSMTEVMGAVHTEGLLPLLRPHPAIDRKRVAILYEPMAPAASPVTAAANLSAAEFRVNTSRKPSARDRKDLAVALATADEEARGHPLIDFAVLITATVRSTDELAQAEAAIDAAGPAARLLLRREDGTQAAAFAQGLPGPGLVMSRHLAVPASLKEAL
jgi:hypothetical protein